MVRLIFKIWKKKGKKEISLELLIASFCPQKNTCFIKGAFKGTLHTYVTYYVSLVRVKAGSHLYNDKKSNLCICDSIILILIIYQTSYIEGKLQGHSYFLRLWVDDNIYFFF